MKKQDADAPSNSFMAVLQRKETQVGTLSEASDVLAAAVRAASVTGKKATITVAEVKAGTDIEPFLGRLA